MLKFEFSKCPEDSCLVYIIKNEESAFVELFADEIERNIYYNTHYCREIGIALISNEIIKDITDYETECRTITAEAFKLLSETDSFYSPNGVKLALTQKGLDSVPDGRAIFL